MHLESQCFVGLDCLWNIQKMDYCPVALMNGCKFCHQQYCCRLHLNNFNRILWVFLANSKHDYIFGCLTHDVTFLSRWIISHIGVHTWIQQTNFQHCPWMVLYLKLSKIIARKCSIEICIFTQNSARTKLNRSGTNCPLNYRWKTPNVTNMTVKKRLHL